MDKDIVLLESRLNNVINYPMLLLGAGFSRGAFSANGGEMLLGKEVAKGLYDEVITPHISDLPDDEKIDAEFYSNRGKLKEICDIIETHKWTTERNQYFAKTMKNCSYVKDKSSADCIDFGAITSYPWPFIFTLNIDDLVENIFRDEKKNCTVWVKKDKVISFNPECTTLVKLHGCVNKDVEHYVFSTEEYNQFIKSSNLLLERFGDEAFTRDVIIVGTQFQENDLKNIIGSMIDRGCNSKNAHYFFISPGDYQSNVAEWFTHYTNFHHIKWTNKEFFDFLRRRVSISKTKKTILTGNFFGCWNDELRNAALQKDITHDLYYGRTPIAEDFINCLDIDRISEEDNNISINEKFKAILADKTNHFIAIKGNIYVGKTCLAFRLLTICAEQGFECFYTRASNYETINRAITYVTQADSNTQIAFYFEDAASCYYDMPRLMELGSKVARLIIIVTSEEKEHDTKSHNLAKIPDVVEYSISDKLNKKAAEKIYVRLREKNQLGELQRNLTDGSAVKARIRHIGDFIDVLYYAHSGRELKAYFEDWYRRKEGNEYINVFQALVVFSSIGASRFSVNLFSEVGERIIGDSFKFDVFSQEYNDFIIEENGRIRLHGKKLLFDIVKNEITSSVMLQWIRILLIVLCERIRELDRNEYSYMFENAAKVKNLLNELNLDVKECIALFKGIEKNCGKLSFYWIQLSILYRDNEEFEEAVNSIIQAEHVRGFRTYQIAHADAKNYLTWGIYAASKGFEDSENYFIRGREILQKLIKDRQYYKDAYGFSVHTYVNMTIRYYKICNKLMDAIEWYYIEDLIITYMNETNYRDTVMTSFLNETISYAKKNNLDTTKLYEAKRIMQNKPQRLSLSVDIDEMPAIRLK